MKTYQKSFRQKNSAHYAGKFLKIATAIRESDELLDGDDSESDRGSGEDISDASVAKPEGDYSNVEVFSQEHSADEKKTDEKLDTVRLNS